jgi:hypothetical protein
VVFYGNLVFAEYVFVGWLLMVKLLVLLNPAGRAAITFDVGCFFHNEEKESSPCP